MEIENPMATAMYEAASRYRKDSRAAHILA